MLEDDQINFTISSDDVAKAKENYKANGYDLLVDVPKIVDINDTKLKAGFYSEEKLSLVMLERVERKLSRAFKDYKIGQSGIDQSVLDNLPETIETPKGEIIVGHKQLKISKLHFGERSISGVARIEQLKIAVMLKDSKSNLIDSKEVESLPSIGNVESEGDISINK